MNAGDKEQTSPRPFLGIKFECCGVYSRIYKDKKKEAYEGRCPKCLRNVEVKVDRHSGSNSRFFIAH